MLPLSVSGPARAANSSTWSLRLSPYSDDLPEVQLIVVHLGDEDGSHGLVESCPVHVDGGSHGQHEPRDPPVHVVVLQQALESDGQCG